MIGGLAAFILLCTVSLIQAAEVPQQISVTVAEVGGNVTLQCPVSETEGSLFYWYKQPLGYMVQTVVAVIFGKLTVSEQFDNTRFTATRVEAQCFLTISNISKEDEATYFCLTGATYSRNFINGIFLAVNDGNQQSSYYVKQSPETESVQPGEAATLQCSLLSKKENTDQCPAEHSVYWFRSGSGESHPGIIYTHRDEQEEPSCHYSLSKTIQNSSDAGTYYCAVVTCGQILLGGGTTVVTGNTDSRSELVSVVLVLGVLVGCCVTVIAVLIFDRSQRKVCEHCKAAMSSQHLGHDGSTVEQSDHLDGEAKSVNYAALDFSTRKMKRGNRKERETCMYSVVRADYHSQHPPSL